MKCSKVIERFLQLEEDEFIPLSIRLHILFCQGCRNEIVSLRSIFRSLQETAPFEMAEDITDSIMDSIIESGRSYDRVVSSSKWLAVGSLILASIFLIPFSNSFIWLKVHFGGNLEIPLNIIMGLAITIYSALFIGTHLDELKKYLNRKTH